VEAGQNVYRLSLQYGCEQSVLLAANGLRDARALRVGQVLRIPACGHTVPGAAPGGPSASGPAVAARTQGRATPAQAEEGVQAQGRLALRSRERGGGAPEVAGSGAARGLLDWPLRGVLYGRFGKKGREPHDGIDLAAPAGTPVQVAAPGVVLYAGEQRGYGHIVLVEHAGGLITLYAHNRELRVRTGQAVREREVVATVGESGRTSGPHLHFEVRRDGVAVDPLPYLGPPPPAGS
jgi:murein DD-endopeptidase MepM/ murein hydrolase activator NlpD